MKDTVIWELTDLLFKKIKLVKGIEQKGIPLPLEILQLYKKQQCLERKREKERERGGGG